MTLNFVDTDIREIVRAVLGTTLKVAYTIDPAVHGTGSIETPTPLPRSALIGTLETLLNENGAALVVRDGIYSVVPVPAGAIGNLASGANAIGAGAEVVPLRYAAARDLAKILEPYVGQGGKITADPAANAVLVSGDAAVRQTLVGLIRAFDIDILSGRSYALFPVGDADPAKLAGELEKVMQAQGEGSLSGIVQVLPMERVNAVLVVSAQPRYLDAADRFFHLAQRAEDATSRTWHVYYVQNGQSSDLEALLQRAFTPGNVSPTPPAPGTTAPGATPAALGFGNQAGGNPGVGGGLGGLSTTGAAGGGTGTSGAGTTGGGGWVPPSQRQQHPRGLPKHRPPNRSRPRRGPAPPPMSTRYRRFKSGFKKSTASQTRDPQSAIHALTVCRRTPWTWNREFSVANCFRQTIASAKSLKN